MTKRVAGQIPEDSLPRSSDNILLKLKKPCIFCKAFWFMNVKLYFLFCEHYALLSIASAILLASIALLFG